jgi:hypothetical protein
MNELSKKELLAQISALKGIIWDIQWMARRYAHGRQSYAVGQYNDAIRLAQRLGMEFKPDPIDGLIEAKDAMFDKQWFEENSIPKQKEKKALEQMQRTLELNEKICEIGACVHEEHKNK